MSDRLLSPGAVIQTAQNRQIFRAAFGQKRTHYLRTISEVSAQKRLANAFLSGRNPDFLGSIKRVVPLVAFTDKK